MSGNTRRLTPATSHGSEEHHHGQTVDTYEHDVDGECEIVHVRMVQDHAEDVSSHERAQRGSDAQRVHDRRIQGVSACIHGACHKQQKVKHLEAKHQKTGQNGKPTFAEKRRQQKHACHNWEQNSVERKHVESTFGEELYQSNDKSRARHARHKDEKRLALARMVEIPDELPHEAKCAHAENRLAKVAKNRRQLPWRARDDLIRLDFFETATQAIGCQCGKDDDGTHHRPDDGKNGDNKAQNNGTCCRKRNVNCRARCALGSIETLPHHEKAA